LEAVKGRLSFYKGCFHGNLLEQERVKAGLTHLSLKKTYKNYCYLKIIIKRI